MKPKKTERSNVIDLDSRRPKPQLSGHHFVFHAFDYTDECVGFIDHAEKPVAILFDEETRCTGLCASKTDVEKLIKDLQSLLVSPFAPWNRKEGA